MGASQNKANNKKSSIENDVLERITELKGKGPNTKAYSTLKDVREDEEKKRKREASISILEKNARSGNMDDKKDVKASSNGKDVKANSNGKDVKVSSNGKDVKASSSKDVKASSKDVKVNINKDVKTVNDNTTDNNKTTVREEKKSRHREEIKIDSEDKSKLLAHLYTFIKVPKIHHRLIQTVLSTYCKPSASTSDKSSTSTSDKSSTPTSVTLPTLNQLIELCISLNISVSPEGVDVNLYKYFVEFCIVNWGAFPSQESTDYAFRYYDIYKNFPTLLELESFCDELQLSLTVSNSVNTELHSSNSISESKQQLTTGEIPLWISIASQSYSYCAAKTSKVITCPICLEDLVDGDQCVMLLACSHIMHSETSKCNGVVTWVKMGHDSCPTCKETII